MMEYFTIPRKERLGIMALLGLVGMVWLIPFLWRTAEKADAQHYFTKAGSVDIYETRTVVRLYDFDPNKIRDDEWLNFGIPEHTVKSIRNYLNKGGRFRKPEALLSIYGMDTVIAKKLIPFVKIKEEKSIQAYGTSIDLDVSTIDSRFRKPAQKELTILDINSADSASLEALPWIGEKMASRIIKFRDACGGFYTVDQIAGIYGVSDTAFLHFRSYLQIGKKEIRRLNVNTDPIDILSKHPYIQYRQAKALVAYRTQHGPFKSGQDLLAIPMFDTLWLDKIQPYLSF